MFQVGGAVMLGLIMWGLVEGREASKARREIFRSSDGGVAEMNSRF
jgi:hypothetical protein